MSDWSPVPVLPKVELMWFALIMILRKYQLLKEGTVPIFEPGLERMIKRNIEKGRLVFTNDIEEGNKGSEVIFIAVGTPPGEDGSADLKHVIDCRSRDWKNIK